MALATADTIFTLDDAALGEWADGLTTRIGLQSELVWVGLNDGYTDAGGRDVAIPYLGLWWILGLAKRHCVDCPAIAMGSPYDPPGTPGGKTIYQSPGDGQTQCGAGCKCFLEYGLPRVSTPRNYAWNNLLPGPGAATREIGQQQLRREAMHYSWQEAVLLDPESEYFTTGQKAALDLFRAKWFAWEDVRGSLPQLPQMFAEADAADSLRDLDMFLNDMNDQQRGIFYDIQDAIGQWNEATRAANEAAGAEGADALPDETGGETVGMAEPLDDGTISLFGFGGFRIGGFGRGAGRAGRGGGHGDMLPGGRRVLRQSGGRFNGSEKGTPKEKESTRGSRKGEEEQSSHSSGRKTSSASKSPNNEASRKMTRGERKAAQREAQAKITKAQQEHDTARAAYKQQHDDSPLGLEMPFTRDQFIAAVGTGQRLSGGNTADARLTTINGERYVVKQVVGGGRGQRQNETTVASKYRQANAETAGVQVAHIVGLEHDVPATAFVIHHDMNTYSVQTFERGTPLSRLSNREREAFDQTNAGAVGTKRMLFEYVVGRVDGHGGNYLLNSATGGVKMIDFGNDFTARAYFSPFQTMIARSVLATHGARTSERDTFPRPQEMRALKLEKAAIHDIVTRAPAIRETVHKFHFNDEAALLKRLGILEKLDALDAPTMHDLMILSGTPGYKG